MNMRQLIVNEKWCNVFSKNKEVCLEYKGIYLFVVINQFKATVETTFEGTQKAYQKPKTNEGRQ